ncbi:hypothetical protein SAMN04487821_11065 [Enterococcus malodoratus]|uniref:4'-phosphopantetheinyl transferase family protein n=1 Tax=Enterococcus malodoratus TaxID=71451 RepID=UPI0008CD66E5|nr:hypothetical protein [Enterococcus malodoratus]SET34293.1 hypothetical protein SAMN04487821_11065 [Enterococcus malodoratus]
MKKVVIYPIKEMIYDKVLSFVRQYAPRRYQYLNKFYKRGDRYNSAVVYVLLCIAYDQIVEEFEIGEFGKPYFNNPNQFLSISHSSDIVSVAVSDDDIAIDCESNQSIDEAIINMTFTNGEKNLVEKGIIKKNTIWTAKESISKLYNEDWYSYPRTEITNENGIVYDKNNLNIFLEFIDLENNSVCIASKNKEHTEIYQISENAIKKLIK